MSCRSLASPAQARRTERGGGKEKRHKIRCLRQCELETQLVSNLDLFPIRVVNTMSKPVYC